MPAARSLLIAATLVTACLSGCASRSENREPPSSSATAASSESTAAGDQNSAVVEAFGGAYESRELSSYLNGVAHRLSPKSAPGSLKVVVLDSPIVNAFTTADGYIFVTRGLLALVNNEGELAGVLAHEMGHIAATSATSESSGHETAATTSDQPLILRDMDVRALEYLHPAAERDEYQATVLGVGYMRDAGYDPSAMTALLASIRDYERLIAQIDGRPPESISRFGYLTTHPDATNIYQRALAASGGKSKSTPSPNRDAYLSRIDGMPYGPRAALGLLRGSMYENPLLLIRFVFPSQFEIFETKDRIYALGPKDSVMVFETVPQSYDGPMDEYVAKVWAKDVKLSGLRPGHLRNMKAATAIVGVPASQPPREMRLFAVRVDPTHVYRFRFEYPTELKTPSEYRFLKTISTFTTIPESRAQTFHELELKLLDVRNGETVASLASKAAFRNFQIEFFRILNGLGAKDSVAPATRVKTVRQNEGTPLPGVPSR
jgi:predicted Zn-dependent protease